MEEKMKTIGKFIQRTFKLYVGNSSIINLYRRQEMGNSFQITFEILPYFKSDQRKRNKLLGERSKARIVQYFDKTLMQNFGTKSFYEFVLQNLELNELTNQFFYNENNNSDFGLIALSAGRVEDLWQGSQLNLA